MKKTVVLVVLDGWGIGSLDESNPIYKADLQTMKYIHARFPGGALQASGIAVGLPYDEEGNSEVGHLTMGAGRVISQHFPEISAAVKSRAFFENKVFRDAFRHAKEKKSAVHFVGLLSEGNVHASLGHLEALIKMSEEAGVDTFFLHLFSDGRDSAPRSFLTLLDRLGRDTGISVERKLATVSGRYYAMDRDKHWERTEAVYGILTGAGGSATTIGKVTEDAYGRNLNDEYLEPSIISPHPIGNNDTVIFFNFREDRMRQIVQPFIDPSFSRFPVKKIENLFIATMTSYDHAFKVPVAFPDGFVPKTLGEVLSDNGKMQLRIAETQKYAHITYFFNGLRENPFPGEYRILIPSENTIHYDDHPAMMAKPITDRIIAALSERTFDFILANYANPDMVAHTGNYEAAIAAVRTIDAEMKRLIETALPLDHVVLITSDHGNAEVLLNLATGELETKHDPNPVPLYLASKDFLRKKPIQPLSPLPVIGMISDVAPTVLDLMKIPEPNEMNGQSLLPELFEEI